MGKDSESLYPADSFAYAKRAYGFVPKTIFYDEPTGALNAKKEVVFFQDFGIPHPSELFRTIYESELPEITEGDLYDLRNRAGRWALVADPPDRKHAVAWLLEHGYRLPEPQRIADGRYVPVWPPKLVLVSDEPAWICVMQQEEVTEKRMRAEQKEMDERIAKACIHCATGTVLSLKDAIGYTHGRSYSALLPCAAEALHEKRGTFAIVVMKPSQGNAGVS